MSTNVNVKNNFSRVSPGFSRNNIFNLARDKWTIDGILVSATAAQLNSLNPTFGKFVIVQTMDDFPAPDDLGGIHLENKTWYLITEELDMGVNLLGVPTYFELDVELACKLSSSPGCNITCQTTGSMFRGVGFTTLFLEQMFVNVPAGQVFDLQGGLAADTIIIGDVKKVGTISNGFYIGIDTLVYAGENYEECLTIKDTLIFNINNVLCFAAGLKTPVLSIDGNIFSSRISGVSGFAGDASSWLNIKPTCSIGANIHITGCPYGYEFGRFFWIGQTGAIDSITDNGIGNALIQTAEPHGLVGTANITIDNTADYNSNGYTATVLSPNTFEINGPYTVDNNGGNWTAVAYSFLISFSSGGPGLTLVTTPAGHQQVGEFSVGITGDTVYAGAYVATAVSANTFSIPVDFTIDDVGPTVSWDATSQANENASIIIQSNCELPDSPPSLNYVNKVVNFSDLSSGDVALIASLSDKEQIVINSIRVNSGGPNFTGGDRDIVITDNVGLPITTLNTGYLQAIVGNPSTWGETNVPFGSFNESNGNVVARYANGSTDYTGGTIELYIGYTKIINKLGY